MSCSEIEDDKNMAWYMREVSALYSTDKIESILNEFLATHKIIDIKCETVTCRKNADKFRDDNVDLIYSIVYETNLQSNMIQQNNMQQNIVMTNKEPQMFCDSTFIENSLTQNPTLKKQQDIVDENDVTIKFKKREVSQSQKVWEEDKKDNK